MNLLDHTVTPMWRVWEAVGEAAATEGVELRESELIGLCPWRRSSTLPTTSARRPGCPTRSASRAPRDWLKIRDFDPTMALELRLAAAQAADR